MATALAEITTSAGHALPPHPRHSITVHLPTWQAALDFVDQKPEVWQLIKSMYPRMLQHRDIVELVGHIVKFAKVPEGQTCLLYPSLEAAEHQVKFSSDPRRGDQILKKDDMAIRVFDVDVRYFAVFFAAANTPKAMPFWMHAGVGVSSRMAEESLKHIGDLKEVAFPPSTNIAAEINGVNSQPSVERTLKERIASLLERSPVGGPRDVRVQPDDVYFYQSGMAAIWWTHQYLIDTINGSTIAYGWMFHSTHHVFGDWGSGFKAFGSGSVEDLDEMEKYLETEQREGRKVQAIFAEFPANPALTVPNLSRLRSMADKYDTVLVIDDTIGSFANIDVLGPDGADVQVTSLSKSFSGYADYLGGSAVLNPLSKKYTHLKELFAKRYRNDVCPLDLAALESNSRDYLERSKVLNHNAQVVVNWLQKKAEDPNSSVSRVMYPTVGRDKSNYDACKRPDTSEFSPGYGCLFSVEFNTIPETIAFYDTMAKFVHIGPHLGAHRTLMLCYIRAIHAKELEAVQQYGLNATALRVSVGFQDDADELLRGFEIGVAAADAVKDQSEEMQKGINYVPSIS